MVLRASPKRLRCSSQAVLSLGIRHPGGFICMVVAAAIACLHVCRMLVISPPSRSVLGVIFSSILDGHLSVFNPDIKQVAPPCVCVISSTHLIVAANIPCTRIDVMLNSRRSASRIGICHERALALLCNLALNTESERGWVMCDGSCSKLL